MTTSVTGLIPTTQTLSTSTVKYRRIASPKFAETVNAPSASSLNTPSATPALMPLKKAWNTNLTNPSVNT